MELLEQFIAQITTLRGPPAVVITIIFVGYFAKMCPWIENKWIPLISFVLGPVLTLLIVGWPTTDTMAPGVRWPEIAAWATSIIQGFLLSCLAWASHAKVLRQLIDDKIPALQSEKPSAPTPPSI